MTLSNKDYLEILKFYKIKNENLKKSEIKNKAEKILITKLCRCIKSINKKKINTMKQNQYQYVLIVF